MKIAAIDLGSNSFHMVIVEVSAAGGSRLVAGAARGGGTELMRGGGR